MGGGALPDQWAASTITCLAGPNDLGELVTVLALAYAVVLAMMAVATGWQTLTDRRSRRKQRGVVVPPVGATAPDDNNGPGGKQQRARCRSSGSSIAERPWHTW